MPGLTGIESLTKSSKSARHRSRHHRRPCQRRDRIEAVRLGAFDYVTKPCKLAEIEGVLRKIRRKAAIYGTRPSLSNRVSRLPKGDHSVGNSPAMSAVHKLIATVGADRST